MATLVCRFAMWVCRHISLCSGVMVLFRATQTRGQRATGGWKQSSSAPSSNEQECISFPRGCMLLPMQVGWHTCRCVSLCVTLEHPLWVLRCWDCAITTSALLRAHCSNHLFCLRQDRQCDQRGSHNEGVHHGGNLYFCQSVHLTIASNYTLLGHFCIFTFPPHHGNCICVRPRQCVLHQLATRSNRNHGVCAIETW
jgi:hypothetical protein